MSKVQTQLVLDHLIDHGYITPLVGTSYGIQRLGARIHELIRQGVRIENSLLTNDVGVRYSRYTLLDRDSELKRRVLGFGWRTGPGQSTQHRAACRP